MGVKVRWIPSIVVSICLQVVLKTFGSPIIAAMNLNGLFIVISPSNLQRANTCCGYVPLGGARWIGGVWLCILGGGVDRLAASLVVVDNFLVDRSCLDSQVEVLVRVDLPRAGFVTVVCFIDLLILEAGGFQHVFILANKHVLLIRIGCREINFIIRVFIFFLHNSAVLLIHPIKACARKSMIDAMLAVVLADDFTTVVSVDPAATSMAASIFVRTQSTVSLPINMSTAVCFIHGIFSARAPAVLPLAWLQDILYLSLR